MKQGLKYTVFILGVTFFIPLGAQARIQDVSQSSQLGVKVTLYPEIALIKDQRRTFLKEGRNKLLIKGVPSSILMDTFIVQIMSPEVPLLVSEYTFLSPHLTQEELLRHSLGEPITLLPLEASSAPLPGKLLALDGDEAIVKAMDIIFSVKKARVGYPYLPHTLVPEPIITLKGEAVKEGTCLFEMEYLTKGFSWAATYTVIVDDVGGKLDLTNWINIRNQSGMDIKKGQFRMAFSNQTGERFYKIKNPLTLADQAAKNIAWVSAQKVLPTQSFRIYSTNNILEDEAGILLKPPIETWLSVQNTRENGLGVPLPQGKMRVFRRSADGSLMYVGENATHFVPVKGALSLRLGSTKAINAEMSQTDHRILGAQIVESAYRLDLKNMTPENKQVTFFQNVSGDWNILRETLPHEEEEGRVKWTLSLKPHESVSLRYRVGMRNVKGR